MSATIVPEPIAAPARPIADTSVAVLGLGYVGLPTALALHDAGASVLGVDVSERRLDAIRRRDVDLLAGDRARLGRALESDRFALAATPDDLSGADAVLICVPTPVDEHRRPDLGPLTAACETAVDHARPGQLIVLTSTSAVGTTRALLAEPLATERGLEPGRDVHVAFSPERVDPGNESHAQETVPRVVAGWSPACLARAEQLLAPACAQLHAVSSVEAAELTKLYENTFRAVNIALANELADGARALGLDPLEITRAAATKPYGYMPFYPGPGVGGHCIPCDPHYLLDSLAAAGAAAPLVERSMDAIDRRPAQVVARAAELLGGSLEDRRVLVAGVAYKPGVQDVRESPALAILEELTGRGARAAYHDPLVPELALERTPLRSEPDPCASEPDLAILVTPHAELAWDRLATCPRVLDATYRAEAIEHREVL